MPPSGDPAGAGRRRLGADGRLIPRYPPAGTPRDPPARCAAGEPLPGWSCGLRPGPRAAQRCWRSLRTRPHHTIECASTHRAVSADPRTFVVSVLSALSGRPGRLIVRRVWASDPVGSMCRRAGNSRLDVPACRLAGGFRDRMLVPDGLVRSRRRGTGSRRQGPHTSATTYSHTCIRCHPWWMLWSTTAYTSAAGSCQVTTRSGCGQPYDSQVPRVWSAAARSRLGPGRPRRGHGRPEGRPGAIGPSRPRPSEPASSSGATRVPAPGSVIRTGPHVIRTGPHVIRLS